MGMEGAVIIFRRSIQLHSFRYSQMLGDGDAKTYARVCEDDPYDGRPIKANDWIHMVWLQGLCSPWVNRGSTSPPPGCRTTYADTNLGRPDDEGVLDVSVSIDGSWQ